MEWTSTLLGVWWRNVHKRKGQLKVQPSHAQVRSKKIKMLPEGFFIAHYKPSDWPCPLNLPSRSQAGWALEGRGDGGKKKRANQMEMNTHEWKVEAEVTRRWSGSGANRWSRPLGVKAERLNTQVYTHRDTHSVRIYCISTDISPMTFLCREQATPCKELRITSFLQLTLLSAARRGEKKHTQFYSDALQSLAGRWLTLGRSDWSRSKLTNQ